MLRKNSWRRKSVITVEAVFVILFVVASVLALCDHGCVEKVRHLTLDGLYVAAWCSALQLLALAHRSERVCQFGELWCVGRRVLIHHGKYGMLGGYTFGVVSALIECWTK